MTSSRLKGKLDVLNAQRKQLQTEEERKIKKMQLRVETDSDTQQINEQSNTRFQPFTLQLYPAAFV